MGASVVAVIFGGRSAEHEVSILTAHEAMAVLRAMPAYEVVPVYITKGGRWLTGEALNDLDKFANPERLETDCRPISLRPMDREVFTSEKTGLFGKAESIAVDVALPLIHGPNGEDGTLQGALDMLGVPYAMSGVLASALCMDKVATKRMLAAAGLIQVPYAVATRAGWIADPAKRAREGRRARRRAAVREAGSRRLEHRHHLRRGPRRARERHRARAALRRGGGHRDRRHGRRRGELLGDEVPRRDRAVGARTRRRRGRLPHLRPEVPAVEQGRRREERAGPREGRAGRGRAGPPHPRTAARRADRAHPGRRGARVRCVRCDGLVRVDFLRQGPRGHRQRDQHDSRARWRSTCGRPAACRSPELLDRLLSSAIEAREGARGR